MSVYRTKCQKLKGTDYREVRKKAFRIYTEIKKQSKRKPYVRSAYFSKEKVFLGIFWGHIFQKKNFSDQIRRLKLYPCALELIKNSRFAPTSKINVDRNSEILHRFIGLSRDEELFFVQIKENIRTKQKWLISIFPKDSKKALR